MKRTEQVSVAQLIEELKRFEKDYPDVNVTCCIPDGTICYSEFFTFLYPKVANI